MIAPGSLAFYRGAMFPEWRGDALVAGLAVTSVVRLVVKDGRVTGEERLLADRGDRIRDVVEGPDGALWLATDADPGKILRVSAGR